MGSGRAGPPWGSWGRRDRPPWWPEGEAWPPEGPEGWRLLRRRFARRAAFFGLGFVVLVVLLVTVLVSAVTTLVGTHTGRFIFGPIVLIVVGLVLWRAFRAFRVAVAPLGELVEASARVEAGELGTQVSVRGPREVRALARAFNAMSTRLASTEAGRRRLLADVSHELRTPLTVIKGNVEAILDGLYPADREHLERILAETHQLERLIEDLRTLSLAETGALPLHLEPTDLVALAREVVAGFQAQAAAGGVALGVEAPDEAGEHGGVVRTLDVDPQRIRQVVTNLVSNALRHTPAGGHVTVALLWRNADVELRVSDTGTGMEPAAAEHAFDRFSRSSESPGAGLGLAIVRDLVQAHGGTVQLETAPGLGTTVRCRLPIAP